MNEENVDLLYIDAIYQQNIISAYFQYHSSIVEYSSQYCSAETVICVLSSAVKLLCLSLSAQLNEGKRKQRFQLIRQLDSGSVSSNHHLSHVTLLLFSAPVFHSPFTCSLAVSSSPFCLFSVWYEIMSQWYLLWYLWLVKNAESVAPHNSLLLLICCPSLFFSSLSLYVCAPEYPSPSTRNHRVILQRMEQRSHLPLHHCITLVQSLCPYVHISLGPR